MLKNLFRFAIRNLIKDGWFSLLNIIGLTIGISFCIFLIFYIQDELSYDRGNKNADRIYRVSSYIRGKDKITGLAVTASLLGPTMQRELPGVQVAVRLIPKERTLVKRGDHSFYESKIFYADSNIFNVFTIQFLAGYSGKALTDSKSVILSKTTAARYFGENASVIGETIKIGDDLRTITGIFEDVPRQSNLRYDMLIPLASKPGIADESWGDVDYYTYILLKPGATAETVSKGLQKINQKYVDAVFARFNLKIRFDLQPITDIHLHSDLQWEQGEVGSMSYIWIFSAVAFLMLLTACINYLNLTTARSARRAKEIGIRKVAGSTRGQLVLQFLSESIATALIAVLLSYVFILLLLPTFNSLSGKTFTVYELLRPGYLFLVLGIGLFTGVAGGSYPAFYLSGFRPIGVLKGALSKASGNVQLRRILVVLQFTISLVMLICTWVIYSQLAYLNKKDLGFNKDQVLLLPVNNHTVDPGRIDALEHALVGVKGVQMAATGDSYPGGEDVGAGGYGFQTETGHVVEAVANYRVDEHFLNVLEIPILLGRNFSTHADTLREIIVNESLVRHFGWKQPIGMHVQSSGSDADWVVVGVCKDFNQKALYNPIMPLILFFGRDNHIVQVKIAGANLNSPIPGIENTWKKYFPESPFEYKFLDGDLQTQYKAEQQRGKIFVSFSVLTIVITCLGLLGLTAFVTQQKQKEISIRKILGASYLEILALVIRQYIWLTLIASGIAFPIAYYFMHLWLDIFAYHTGLSFLPFVVSAVILVVTTVLTVIFHSAKAAMANPANTLRTDR